MRVLLSETFLSGLFVLITKLPQGLLTSLSMATLKPLSHIESRNWHTPNSVQCKIWSMYCYHLLAVMPSYSPSYVTYYVN